MTHQCDRVHVENSQLPIRFERALVQLGLLYLPSLRMQLVPVFSLVFASRVFEFIKCIFV